MCDRPPLFLFEVKSILCDLLKRTVELFDLSVHLVEHYHLTTFLSQREQQRDYRHFSLHKPCRLNYNVISDLNSYLRRLYTTCRLTKSSLRSLHAARITSSNDYIVIDDEIYELIKFFKSKLNSIKSIEKERQQSSKITNQRYQSQRLVHSSHPNPSFVFHPDSSNQKNNSQKLLSSPTDAERVDEYHPILLSFQKISQFYQFLVQQLYGVHIVRDSHVLQPVVISIIRLLLFITNQLKDKLQISSPTKIHRNRFSVQQREEVCREHKEIFSSKPKVKLIEIPPDQIDTLKAADGENSVEYVRNDNHSANIKDDDEEILEFDEDEFYRLANLQRDD